MQPEIRASTGKLLSKINSCVCDTVILNDIHYSCRFLVMNGLKYDVIIGADFLNKHNVIIDYDSNEVKLGDNFLQFKNSIKTEVECDRENELIINGLNKGLCKNLNEDMHVDENSDENEEGMKGMNNKGINDKNNYIYNDDYDFICKFDKNWWKIDKYNQMYTIKDDPLIRAVSLIGRVGSERVRQYPGSLRRSGESLEEHTTLSTRLKNHSPTNSLQGMDLWRGIYTLTQVNHVTIDSLVFRLHSNATVILLVTFSIAVTTRQYVGNPIECVHTRDIPEDVLNTYCWIHSTYTVIDAFMKTPGSQVAYPGVETSLPRSPSGKSTTRQVRYYQWVAFMLFFQVIMPLTLDQEKFLLEAYFRSGERDPNGQWKYSTRSCIDDLTTEFPDIDLDYESLSRHVLRTVERFRNTGSVAKGKSSGRRTVLNEEVVEDIRARLDQSPRKPLRQLAQQTGSAILHAALALEIMGGWENTCFNDGFGYRNLLGNREEIKEEINAGLFMREFSVPQLVGLQVYHMRGLSSY
ncbi:innexin [Holotrichia oblita]|uniref:Innexin n=1 Tax=Holotrichia oblita TaxID=644536 RepID=A0ACB9SZ78_HOLOL|nr:innexin [Holotrichia oblita]